MRTVTSADPDDALKILTIHVLAENKNGAKTQNVSCIVINCYHICHLIFLLVPVLCIG